MIKTRSERACLGGPGVIAPILPGRALGPQPDDGHGPWLQSDSRGATRTRRPCPRAEE